MKIKELLGVKNHQTNYCANKKENSFHLQINLWVNARNNQAATLKD